ncbi:MAG TPA: hypothetical protein VND19_15995 [Acetobacteraceae bacterium]|nr:hypothetical protein [Acetobacteraceae bacterium]
MSGQQEETNVGVKLTVYWLLVGVPLLWGVAQTIANAMKMFR